MKQIDPKTMSDTELLALSVDEPKVFEVLVDRYQRLFIRKASSILRSEDDAHDAVQDTFVRIYIAARKFKFKEREGASFSSWAYTVLVNQCYTAYKKKHRHALVSLEDMPEFAEVIPDQAAVDMIESKFTSDYVLTLIAKLPVLLRRSVELYFVKGLPQKQIAAQEHVSEGVIRSRIHRAKSELRKMDLDFSIKK